MKKLFVVAALSLSAGGYWLHASQDDPKLALNRIWVSNLPQHDRDKFSIFAMLSEEEIGVFDERSSYQGNFDLFAFEGDSNNLTIHMLQDNKKVKASYTATTCDVKGFDYCLEIKGAPRGPIRYYSMEGWELDSMAKEQALAQKIATRQE